MQPVDEFEKFEFVKLSGKSTVEPESQRSVDLLKR